MNGFEGLTEKKEIPVQGHGLNKVFDFVNSLPRGALVSVIRYEDVYVVTYRTEKGMRDLEKSLDETNKEK